MTFYRTWNNAQISEAVIQQQEQHGLQMAKEKQDYYGTCCFFL